MLVTDPKTGLVTLMTEPKKQKDNYKPPTPRRGDRVALIIQGRGLAVGYERENRQSKTRFVPGDCVVGSFDMEQALKNKELGYW
jgi:hypothetical protein